MKDNEPKVHPLVKLGSALGIISIAVGQAGCAPQPQNHETTPTNFPSTLTIEPPEPPVGFEPSTPTFESVSTPTGVETPVPTESGLPAFRAPTIEELLVPAGEGGPLPEYAQEYYNIMEGAKTEVAQRVGVDPNKINTRYWDNSNSKDAFGWMLYYKIDGGGVIWPLKPDGALADYPAYFEGEVQSDGSLRYLKINSDYNNWVVAGDKDAAVIFGGSLPVIADSPQDTSVDGSIKSVYSRWLRPGGLPADYAKDFSQWEKTPGASESTETPAPTENPNAISAEELLAECPVKLEVSVAMVGKARVEGQDVELNYPNVKLDIVFGLDPSIMNRGKETGFLPYQEIAVNSEYESLFGIDPELQIATDILYTHYRSWQNDEDNKYPERLGVTFPDYLDMLNQGKDGSHKLWVVSEKGKLYPNEQITVEPRMKHVVIFAENYFGDAGNGAGQIKFDAKNLKLIFVVNPKADYGITDPNDSTVRRQGYLSMVGSLGFMIMPEEVQRLGFSGDTSKEVREYMKKFFYTISPNNKVWGNTPLILISNGFSS